MHVTQDRITRINNLVDAAKFKEAKNKCQKYFDNPKFTCLYISILMKEKKYDEAKEMCQENMNYIPIVSQYITLLTYEKNWEEARKVCEKYDIEDIKSQYIYVLLHFNEMDKIREIGECFPYNAYICKQYIIALIHDKDYDRALELCEIHRYDPDIIKLQKYALRKVRRQRIDQLNNKSDYVSEITILMYEKRFDEAKKICKKHIKDRRVNDLYLSILEREKKEKERKKYIYQNNEKKRNENLD